MGPEVPNMFTGLIFEGIFYGLYCVVLYLYLRIQSKRIDRQKSILVYVVIANFILCTAFFALECAHVQLILKSYLEAGSPSLWFSGGCLSAAVNVLYTTIDFITHATLIYRCWIVWRRPWIMVVPIILSLGFLATALTATILWIRTPGYGTATPEDPSWYYSAVSSYFSISSAVNALVTGLIVFKILNVCREFQGSNNCAVYTYGKGPRDIVLMLVESGMITFVGQLLQAVLYKANPIAFPLISGVVVMLFGISMTIVLVRVQMGVSYDNETWALTSHPLRFATAPESKNEMMYTTGKDPNPGSDINIVQDV